MHPLFLLILLTAFNSIARADSGVVRASAIDGSWRITAFSEPTPLRVGLADLTVLVQNAEDDEPILNATVSLLLKHENPDRPSILIEATHENATNQMLYSSLIDLPASGQWSVEVAVMRGEELGRLSFVAQVAEPLPMVYELWFWFILPILAIVLIIINQWLQRRHGQKQVQ
ncbi:MAG: hypothetical protein MK089_09355 [Phycisphaerales bacterium]|nr:hypothetical protein [Phycisphaerales bacterium]